MPTTKRHTGNQPRTASTRLFALIDEALASTKGLWPSHFTKDHSCSVRTLTNYLTAISERGVKLYQANGVWRYAEGQPPLFTSNGSTTFTRD